MSLEDFREVSGVFRKIQEFPRDFQGYDLKGFQNAPGDFDVSERGVGISMSLASGNFEVCRLQRRFQRGFKAILGFRGASGTPRGFKSS